MVGLFEGSFSRMLLIRFLAGSVMATVSGKPYWPILIFLYVVVSIFVCASASLFTARARAASASFLFAASTFPRSSSHFLACSRAADGRVPHDDGHAVVGECVLDLVPRRPDPW